MDSHLTPIHHAIADWTERVLAEFRTQPDLMALLDRILAGETIPQPRSPLVELAELQQLFTERDELAAQNAALVQERDGLLAERAARMATPRREAEQRITPTLDTAARAERDQLVAKVAELTRERAALTRERDALLAERAALCDPSAPPTPGLSRHRDPISLERIDGQQRQARKIIRQVLEEGLCPRNALGGKPWSADHTVIRVPTRRSKANKSDAAYVLFRRDQAAPDDPRRMIPIWACRHRELEALNPAMLPHQPAVPESHRSRGAAP